LQDRLGNKAIYMPVALELAPPAPMPRVRFNLPPSRFLFFFAFDFLSFVERKNPGALIAAFRQAFPRRGQAGLVLKCMNGAIVPEKLARFWKDLADDPEIFLIDDTLSRADTLALIASTDAVVSLHRSEGLGLLIAEAMLLGKPVIATDYSASRDLPFAATGYPVSCKLVPVHEGEYPFAGGQVWAEPDISHAATLMPELCSDPAPPVAVAALSVLLLNLGSLNVWPAGF
jgi:glycosyltransferase involved in cell wall biosynthesis